MFFRRLKFVWKKKCHISQQNDDRCGKQSKALAFQSEDLINLFIFRNLNFDLKRTCIFGSCTGFAKITELSVQMSILKWANIYNSLNAYKTRHKSVKAFNKKTWQLFYLIDYLIFFDLDFWFQLSSEVNLF